MKSLQLIIRGLLLAAPVMLLAACDAQPAPFGAVPGEDQVRWQEMEYTMFCHFGPNTFTGAEWGDGTEPEDVFNPTDLDCRQWVATAKAAGMKGIIVTAKHHDGFCLWPNPVSRHTVAQSAWRDGQGDILRELSEACREYGIEFGIYISPWDRHDPHYGTDAYNEVFRQTLESALSAYGPVFEQWFDGANGEGPNGKKQVYDWELFHTEVLKHQPHAIMFGTVGPDCTHQNHFCRWVGNENGYSDRTCWSTFEPGVESLGSGVEGGSLYQPAETDVSIRPGWFWRESETSQVKSLDALLDIWYGSVGHNSQLLLNVPPDTRGRIDAADSLRLMEFRAALDQIFSDNRALGGRCEASSRYGRKYAAAKMLDGREDTFWAPRRDDQAPSFTVAFDSPRTFNRVVLQEYTPLGQRVKAFTVEALAANGWEQIAGETTIGHKRIVLVPSTEATAVRVTFTDALDIPLIRSFGLYLDTIKK